MGIEEFYRLICEKCGQPDLSEADMRLLALILDELEDRGGLVNISLGQH
jgi:hypothetical protein